MHYRHESWNTTKDAISIELSLELPTSPILIRPILLAPYHNFFKIYFKITVDF